jgi:ParB-like chromosome segregation protein Spo0J
MSKTYVPFTRIEDNPYQSRIDTGDVESLAEKILEHGLRQLPEARLIVDGDLPESYTPYTHNEDGAWWLDDGTAQLATGHRRVHAVQLLNDDDTVTDADLGKVGLRPGHVTVDLQRLTDEEMLDLLTVENAAREELTAVEQARLIEEHREAGRPNSQIADVFGRSSSWVSNRKRLLDYPSHVMKHIHEGNLSVRQATALRPIFEADWEEVDFPEDNSFHPKSILQKALDGRSSEDLRRDVTQFESWMRQLTGETQEEIREQEYEQNLESDHQEDESTQTQSRRDENDAEPARAQQEPTPVDEPRGESRSETDDTPDEGSGRDAPVREEASQGSPGTAASVGGDGAPTSGREEVQGVIREVASVLAEAIDQDVLTRHLVLLNAPSPAAIRGRVQEVLEKHVSMESPDGRAETIEVISEWLEELGYEVDLPAVSPVGQVVPEQIDRLLSAGEDMWDASAAEEASIASLYVAYRVSEDRMERWRREEIAQEIHQRQDAVTEEDFPDRVWSNAQDEIARRLQPETA